MSDYDYLRDFAARAQGKLGTELRAVLAEHDRLRIIVNGGTVPEPERIAAPHVEAAFKRILVAFPARTATWTDVNLRAWGDRLNDEHPEDVATASLEAELDQFPPEIQRMVELTRKARRRRQITEQETAPRQAGDFTPHIEVGLAAIAEIRRRGYHYPPETATVESPATERDQS